MGTTTRSTCRTRAAPPPSGSARSCASRSSATRPSTTSLAPVTVRELLPGLWAGGQPPAGATPDPALVAAVGHPLEVGHLHHAQGVLGVVHGLRWSPLPTPGDWTHLSCSRGEVLVVVVDVRVGSSTYGRHQALRLRAPEESDEPDATAALLVGPGLAHGSTALVDDSLLTHLGPRGRRPEKDRSVHPFDPALRLPWSDGAGPAGTTPLSLPPETAGAPLLADLRAAGRLPTYAAWQAHRAAVARA